MPSRGHKQTEQHIVLRVLSQLLTSPLTPMMASPSFPTPLLEFFVSSPHRPHVGIWVMENRGVLIGASRETTEKIASARCDGSWNIVDSHWDIDKIWGSSVIQTAQSIIELLPRLPSDSLETSPEQGLAEVVELKHFAGRTASSVCIPVTMGKAERPCTLQVSSFPHIAGMMVLSSSTLIVISSSPVFHQLILAGTSRRTPYHGTGA